uniref:Exoglucanase A n=3 Tax=Lygus hesperus TaxID=30085 RepID=A0A0A9YBD2_LYGHE
METATEVPATDLGLQRFWSKRGALHDDELAGFLDVPVFPSASVEAEEQTKSRPSSPVPSQNLSEDSFYQDLAHQIYIPSCKPSCSSEVQSVVLNGAQIGDIPAIYNVKNLRKHELPAVGVYVDKRIVPGFKYRVRPIRESGCGEKWLFKGRALALESIGRGYSRRITFKADPGKLNDNPHYFWADSCPEGFAFEIEIVSAGDKFTVFDANRLPVGFLEILSNQAPQEEVGHRVLGDGCVEKTVRIRALGKVEWYSDDNAELVVPVSGIAVSTKSKDGVKTRVIGTTVGGHNRRGYTLRPGIDNRLRTTVIKGTNIADVPTTYNIIGLDDHELPVIGTYVDPRIVPGFHYKVRPAFGKRRPLFGGRALRLMSVGMGYGKRITFAPDVLNAPENFFWSDSHPDGLGFEPSAVRAGMNFEVHAGELRLGEANVFRADTPQKEEKQKIDVDTKGRKTITKYIHIDMVCHVVMDTRYDETPEPHIMHISGTAVVAKGPTDAEAKILRIENIGLDSQLNILFSTQWDQLVFSPV